MGLGCLVCCCRRTRKTTSSQDLAVSSGTSHHRRQASVGVVPALTSNSGPKNHEAQGQEEDLPPQATHQPINYPSSIGRFSFSELSQSTDSKSHEAKGQEDHEAQGQEEDLPPQATHQPINCPSSIRRYSFSELSQATDNFNEGRIRGSGGFGKVFEAQLSDGTAIAVKRRDTTSDQGRKEFVTEIELCSNLSHTNVLSLLGFCDQGNEMILVYEYMGQGTLAGRLYGSRPEPYLKWEQRLQILIGAGSGLQYLHSCTDRGIIHRDVKGPNILLGDGLVAKIADYGLSKVGPEPDRTHVTTDSKGTRGYLDLEYYNTNHLTSKSDVYAFGVVCLEALCARRAIEEGRPWYEVGLASWAKQKLKDEGDLQGIADQRISSTIRSESLRKFTKIVMRCLAEKRRNRPSMEDVIEQLKIALQLQNRPFGLKEDDFSSGPGSPPVELSDDGSDSFEECPDSSDEGRANRAGSLRWL